MTVTGKPQGERERREIGGVRELDESSGQPQLRQIAMQGDPFNPAKDVREIGWRRAHAPRHIDEPYRIGQVCFQEFLGSTD